MCKGIKKKISWEMQTIIDDQVITSELFISTRDIATRLHCSVDTVYNLRKRTKFRYSNTSKYKNIRVIKI